MHQLPSGRRIALTIEPLLTIAAKPSYEEYCSLLYATSSFESFLSTISIVELRSIDGVPCTINDGKLGHYCWGDLSVKLQDIRCDVEDAQPGQLYCYTRLKIQHIGTERSKNRQWSDNDARDFKIWVSDDATQQWLQRTYLKLKKAFSETQIPDKPADEQQDKPSDSLEEDYPVFDTGRKEDDLPESVIKLIGELIKRDNVNSVSCPYSNRAAWRLLVAEQVRRSQQSNKPLQDAFKLSGADYGFGFDPREWGGDVHVPYEGTCTGDLFVAPRWRIFRTETESATLNKAYYYLLVWRDLGELHHATRQEIGDGWYLYSSTRPYVKPEDLEKRQPGEQSS